MTFLMCHITFKMIYVNSLYNWHVVGWRKILPNQVGRKLFPSTKLSTFVCRMHNHENKVSSSKNDWTSTFGILSLVLLNLELIQKTNPKKEIYVVGNFWKKFFGEHLIIKMYWFNSIIKSLQYCHSSLTYDYILCPANSFI